jgi:hypothetical protein
MRTPQTTRPISPTADSGHGQWVKLANLLNMHVVELGYTDMAETL